MLALVPLPDPVQDWMPDWCLACRAPAERMLQATVDGTIVQQLPVCVQHGVEIIVEPQAWTTTAVLDGPPKLHRKDQT